MARLLQRLPEQMLTTAIERIQSRELDPQSAVRELLAQVECP